MIRWLIGFVLRRQCKSLCLNDKYKCKRRPYCQRSEGHFGNHKGPRGEEWQ
jgi:hypothetical protein